MLRRTLLSSLLQTALLGAAGGIGFAPGKAAARNNARSAPVEECEADLVIVGSGAAGLSAGLAALEAGVRKVVILEKAAIAGGHTMLASGSVSAVFGADVDKLIDAMLTAGAGKVDSLSISLAAEDLGIAVKKGRKDLLEKINKGLASLKASGEFTAIYKKWFGREPSPELLR